jgi:ABC-type maltose transport system permease subunit
MFVVVMIILAAAISLPFLLAQDDDARKRLYMPLCFVPVVLAAALVLLGGFNPFSLYLLGLIFVFPVSAALVCIGIALALRASLQEEEWGVFVKGALLAASPIILFFGMFFIIMLLAG